MKRISTFQQFNEGWFSNLKSKVSQVFSSSKPYDPELKKYNISYTLVGKHEMKFYHKNRLIAEVKLNLEKSTDSPVWDLIIYVYESETPKKGSLPVAPKIEKQKEQPYGMKTAQFDFDSEEAILSFIKWWKSYTKSGKEKNINFNVR